MPFWTDYTHAIYTVLLGLTGLFGGNLAAGIGALGLGVRLALLPVTLTLGLRSLQRSTALLQLEPELRVLRERYRSEPGRLAEETQRLHRHHNLSLIDGGSLLGGLLQAPALMGVYSVVRRAAEVGGPIFWVRSLAAPDLGIAALCGLVASAGLWLAPNVGQVQRGPLVLISALVTTLILSRVAAGVAVYSLASSVVGVAQSEILRRWQLREAA